MGEAWTCDRWRTRGGSRGTVADQQNMQVPGFLLTDFSQNAVCKDLQENVGFFIWAKFCQIKISPFVN